MRPGNDVRMPDVAKQPELREIVPQLYEDVLRYTPKSPLIIKIPLLRLRNLGVFVGSALVGSNNPWFRLQDIVTGPMCGSFHYSCYLFMPLVQFLLSVFCMFFRPLVRFLFPEVKRINRVIKYWLFKPTC